MLYTYKVIEVNRIYDGDTITITIDLGMKIYVKRTVRFKGIDTPEIRGEEREDGLISKSWLVEKINNAIQSKEELFITTHKDKTGKYGRLLADFYIGSIDSKSINEQLLDEGLAEKY